ncbi:ComEC/Rec2 family competence protein [Pseudomonas promysalinigenes]|uniref:Metallo-beta-lactamase domain-containing protein n=1 Tax=Pseudomonas promysalinigenes TaxID=485898 RepID=A0ABY6AJC6_9PSED|nr:MBL fold metallo-hydrolase [Pseudomonas promysalinigenes]UXH39784.1 hypothetical protein N5C08_23030 [Pseudomonas promysalinigenes]
MFRVKAIQANEGDALLVSYGSALKKRHILIDGGPSGSLETLLFVLECERQTETLELEALVVTHYDLDHIQGVIELLNNLPSWLIIRDIWFNGYHHLQPFDILGPTEGDRLSALIRTKGLKWNASFCMQQNHREGPAIQQTTHPVKLRDELEVCVLSPDEAGLKALAANWQNPKLPPPEQSLAPDDLLGRSDKWPPLPLSTYRLDQFRSDRSVPNRSSIALLLTFKGKRMLLAADAWCDVIKNGLTKHLPNGEPIDLLKVSHHGSKGNTDRQLLNSLRCKKFLISTSGKGHNHPDHALIGRLVANHSNPTIYFNYKQGLSGKWHIKPFDWPSYVPQYPIGDTPYVEVELDPDSAST